jgi:hypothetical protein
MSRGTIEEEDALILWDTNHELRITHLVVLSRKTYLLSPDMRASLRHLPKSAGACSTDWLEDGGPTSNAAGMFAHMLLWWGFASLNNYIAALQEFAKIDTAQWAKQQLTHALWLGDPEQGGVPWPPSAWLASSLAE